MKLLIAGGAGYIGSVLVPKIQERGYDVTVVDLMWFGNFLPKETSILQKDIFALETSDLHGFDQVIFLAGLSNDPMAEYSPAHNFIANAAAPAYLGYIAKQAGVRRFIFAGTCSVYGYTLNELYDEDASAVSAYPYGISKLQGEQALLQLNDEEFSVISLRKGTVSGYSPRMRLDLVINTMFKTAISQGVIQVNNPKIWRPVLSMQDCVSAYIRAIEATECISGIFNVASGNYTVGEIADYVKEALDYKLDLGVALEIKNQHQYRNYKVSIQKASNVLGFKPKHDIEDIVCDLLHHESAFKDFDNPNYYNIEVFKNFTKKDFA